MDLIIPDLYGILIFILSPKLTFMRKLLFSFLLGSILTVSCNNNRGSTSNPTNDTCKLDEVDLKIDSCYGAGAGNLIIDPARARDMMADFVTRYKNGGMKEEYWVESCGIEALNTFLTQNDTYDGVWVTFGSDSTKAGYPTTIFFVPTTPVVAPARHNPEWAAVGNITLPAGCSAGNYFSTSSSPQVPDFRTRYRKEGMPGDVAGLSRKVWVSKCVIVALASIIKQYDSTNYPLDGVNVYSASYGNPLPAGRRPYGYETENPSTIVLVPTYKCPNVPGHIPAWDVTQFLYNKYVKLVGAAAVPAFNHGELCPNSCSNLD